MNEVTGYVRIEHDYEQCCRTLKTIKSFRRGEVVARERALCDCEVDRDQKRIVAFARLKKQLRAEFLNVFTDLELSQRSQSVDAVDLAPYQRLLDEVSGDEAVSSMSALEVASVMLRWGLARHVSKIRMFKTLSKMIHSCAATVQFEYSLDFEMGVLKAWSDVPSQTRVGAWLIEDVDCWWKGADVRSRALQAEGLASHPCRCDRCLGPDTCRAVKCPNCADGELVRHEKVQQWVCSTCDFSGSDNAVAGFVKVEGNLIQEVGDVTQLSKDDLALWLKSVEARVGLRHWLAAALWKESYARHSSRKGEQTFRSAFAGLNFLDWLSSRDLSRPPEELLKEIREMALNTLGFLETCMEGVRDLRVLYLRAVKVVQRVAGCDEVLLEQYTHHSGVACNLRRLCAFCKSRLPEPAAEEDDDDLPPSASPDEYCMEARAVTCGICRELSYCDLSCQVSDLPRHREYCIPTAARLHSERVRKICFPME